MRHPLSSKRRILLIVAACLVAVLVAARIALPYIILPRLNAYLATFSPDYSVHIERLHLSFIRMAYRFEKAEAHFKKDGHCFLEVESTEVTIAWRELLHARILTDVVVDHARATLRKTLIEGSQEPGVKPDKDAAAMADKLFPVNVARVEVHKSELQFGDVASLKEVEKWRVSEIEALVLNVTPTVRRPLTFATVQGTLLGSSRFHAVAKARTLDKPAAMKVDFELHDFDLVAANPILLHFVPLNFISGHLDVFAEFKSQHGGLEGYVKPFFKQLDVIDIHEHFIGIKHFAVEVIAALADLILRRADDKTVAAKVPFHGSPMHLQVDLGKVLSTVLQHGFRERLSASLDNQYDLE